MPNIVQVLQLLFRLMLAATSLGFGSQSKALLLPSIHQLIHAAHIVLRLAHVRQSGSARSLWSSPDDIDASNSRAINLEPSLNTSLHHLSSKQNRRVDSSSAQLEENSGKRLSLFCRNHKYISGLGAIGLISRKQACSGTGRVESSDLSLAKDRHRVGERRTDRRQLGPYLKFFDLFVLST